jgi:pyrophosphatase PpaX
MAFGLYLFDLDGTLIDSIALILASFHHTRAVHFGDRLPDDRYLETLGTPLRSAFQRMSPSPESVDAMVKTYVDYNLANHDDMIRPYAGVVDTVSALARRGARLGVVTSKMRVHAERGLRIAGLDGAFSVMVSADDVARGKPDPEPVLLALSRFGWNAGDTLFVGDSTHDIEAGNAAGVPTAAATWGPFTRSQLEGSSPNFWLERPEDVLTI